MAYADLATLLADLLPEVTATDQKNAVGRVLDGASGFIDEYCKRPSGYFNASNVTPTMKRFRGEGFRYLRLPDHVAGSVAVAGYAGTEWYEAENGWLYFKQPNFIADTADEIDEFDFATNLWHRGRLYEVTARWGFAAIPPAITEACRQLTLKLWETQRGILGDLTPSGYVVERAMPLFVRETLNLYRKREFER